MSHYVVQIVSDIGNYTYVVQNPGSQTEAIKRAMDFYSTRRPIQDVHVWPIVDVLDCGRPNSHIAPPIPAGFIPPEALTEVHWAWLWDCKNRGRKIQAIKWVRDALGMGLKEAKDWVEEEMNWPAQPLRW